MIFFQDDVELTWGSIPGNVAGGFLQDLETHFQELIQPGVCGITLADFPSQRGPDSAGLVSPGRIGGDPLQTFKKNPGFQVDLAKFMFIHAIYQFYPA